MGINMDEYFMGEAFKQALKASASMDVPIGCVIVRNNQIIARSYNKRNKLHSVLGHAELLAVDAACRKQGDWRLDGAALYVTLEPCQMCAGAIVQARIAKVVIGAMNPKAGCAGSILNLLQVEKFNHQAEIVTGVMEEECTVLLKDFFKTLRAQKKDGLTEWKYAD